MNEEQNMDFDFGSAIEKIQEMMGTDDGQSKLNNIINALWVLMKIMRTVRNKTARFLIWIRWI